jgi:pimeloyl-ACP methyl ester carboxylesterase
MSTSENIPKTRTLKVSNGVDVFYREAGSKSNPTFLLLHGFPTSSNQFRHLITLLSPFYHILAPDLPGFGFTTTPPEYAHTFANMADTIDSFIEELGIQKFAIYIFDYGAPTGLRLALKRPNDVIAVVSQNGNAYVDGLGQFWDTVRPLWVDNPSKEAFDEAAGSLLTLGATKWQYETGALHPENLDPTAWTLDQALLDRPGQREIQLGLFQDYKNNVKLYPEFQRWFRESNVPILAIWGKNDLIFIPPGAEAFKRDSKNLSVRFVDTGHFALESSLDEISGEILNFFSMHNIK